MTPAEAEALAERTLAAINRRCGPCEQCTVEECATAADRERVASDLAGWQAHALNLGNHDDHGDDGDECPDARRYADGLLRTAALYGVP